MFSSLDTFRDELTAILAAGLPDRWVIVKDKTAANVSLVPAVYIEVASIDGGILPRGQAQAYADIVVVDPKTADEGPVEEHTVKVIGVLDARDDIAWSTATSYRLDSGPFAWRISTTALINIRQDEPDTESTTTN